MSEAKKLHLVKPGADTAGRVDDAHVVLLGLSAAIVSVGDERPRVLAVQRAESADALPFGTFDPIAHRTLESGLRDWVQEQTGLQLGYVEQLYTFGDRGRHLRVPAKGRACSRSAISRSRGSPRNTRTRCRVARLVSLLPVGGLADSETRGHRRADPAASCAVRRRRAERGAARAAARAHPALLRHRRYGLGRRKGARALRAALRGRACHRSPARSPRDARWRASPGARRRDGVRSQADSRDRHGQAPGQDEIPPGGLRADARRSSPCWSSSARWRRFRASACTSRTSAAWSRTRAS